ncbi:hypothetical protein MACH17_03490 [Phaeobacter inhibens]|nr:hypothetical protein MACH17_03490 [Phaeobacter inhibens]
MAFCTGSRLLVGPDTPGTYDQGPGVAAGEHDNVIHARERSRPNSPGGAATLYRSATDATDTATDLQ